MLFCFQFHRCLLWFFQSRHRLIKFELNLFFSFQFPKTQTYIFDFISFFFSNTCIQKYKFPSKHCFYCIPQILIDYIFILTSFEMCFNFSENSSLICVLFRSELFKFSNVLGLSSYLLLVPSLISLWSESILGMNSIF